LWSVFRILTEPVPYTFVSVNNEAGTHIAMWVRASLLRRFTDTNIYGTDSVKICKTRHKISVHTQNIRRYTDILYSVFRGPKCM